MKTYTYLAASAAAVAALMLGSNAAQAQDADIAFNAALTSDYVFRGVSQTNEDPALSGGVDATIGSFYIGAWGSNVDFGDSTDAEFDVYGGYRTELVGFGVDVGVVGYLYLDEPSAADYNYVEYKLAVSRAVGPVSAGAVVYYSPDFFGADDEATYVEVNGAYEIAPKWTVSGAVGEQFLDVSDDYVTWNLGVGYALNDTVAFDVRYHDTDIDNLGIAEDRFVGTIKLFY